jgi:diguanylate cyclase (GGDEF)-like protein/PAS domain S-box-containing protein
MDQVPRQLTDGQMRALQVLARQVRGRIELRLRRRELEQALNQRDRAVTVLSASERRFRRFMDNVPMMSFMKDTDGRFTFYNSKLASCFNVNQTEWLGRTDAEIFPAELAEEYRRNDLLVLRNGAPFEFVEQTVDEAGKATWWKSYKFPCEDENGDISLAGVSIDLTAELGQQAELEGANQRLRELATTDTLTGLRNRRAFEDQLSVEFARSGRTGQVFSVMLLDIDDFKRRNDLWGHAAGDAVLRGLAQILMDTVRLSDLSARYGGEEFVVLLPHTDTGSALILAHRLMNRLAKATWEEEEVTVSIGIACMTDSTESPQALIRAADDALYAAKRGGKNRIVSSAGDRQGI